MEKLFGILFAIMFLLTGCGSDSSPKAGEQVNQQSEVATPKNSQLGITFQEFTSNYDSLIREHGTKQFSLPKVHWKEDTATKTFFYYLGYTVIISGDVDKRSNSLIKITVGCEPKSASREKDAIARATMVFIYVIMAIKPNSSRDYADNVARQLCSNLKKYSMSDGNFEYKSRIYNDILMFSIEPKEL